MKLPRHHKLIFTSLCCKAVPGLFSSTIIKQWRLWSGLDRLMVTRKVKGISFMIWLLNLTSLVMMQIEFIIIKLQQNLRSQCFRKNTLIIDGIRLLSRGWSLYQNILLLPFLLQAINKNFINQTTFFFFSIIRERRPTSEMLWLMARISSLQAHCEHCWGCHLADYRRATGGRDEIETLM